MRSPRSAAALAALLPFYLHAGTQPSQALEVSLRGYVDVQAIAAGKNKLDGGNEDNDSLGADRGFQFNTNSELHLRVDGEAQGGTLYGLKVEFEADQGVTNNVDEAGLFISGGFGRIELGADDGAEEVMRLGGADVAAGTGGIDGDIDRAAGTNPFIADTSDAVKATYYTPRVAGIQAGLSFTPDTGDDGDNLALSGSRNGDNENSLGGGINYEGTIGELEIGLAAVGHYAKGEEEEGSAGSDRAETIRSYSLGGIVAYDDLEFGAAWGQNLGQDELDFITAGALYDFGDFEASLTYNFVNPAGPMQLSTGAVSDGSVRHIVVVSADVGLAPGLALAGDVAYTAAEDDWLTGLASVSVSF